MSKKQHSFVTVGITSLFLIFSVLCLVILALLTLGTSRSDLRMSRLSLEQTTAYYEACEEVTDLCLQLEGLLSDTYEKTENEKDYYLRIYALIDELSDNLAGTSSTTDDADAYSDHTGKLCFSYDEPSHLISVCRPFSDSQMLYAELETCYPQKDEDSYLEIHTWKTDVLGSWKPDTKQHVFKGEVTIS